MVLIIGSSQGKIFLMKNKKQKTKTKKKSNYPQDRYQNFFHFTFNCIPPPPPNLLSLINLNNFQCYNYMFGGKIMKYQ